MLQWIAFKFCNEYGNQMCNKQSVENFEQEKGTISEKENWFGYRKAAFILALESKILTSE